MAKTATKSVSKGAKKTNARKPKRSWSTYIKRSLKQVNKDLSLSGKSVKVVNSYVNDLFERIAAEAAVLVRANKKRTLGSAEIQTAVRLILPAELAKHAMAEGTKAVKASA
eukprot:GILJ01007245.1.p2 GENE.GILJ01007245.1~~GILJ01007245.1.p2  ORF type:complete len:111 (+),score=30.97 GILJ01007245.1:59-391(+)